MKRGRLAVHGHFYQPPRYDPFTGELPPDPTAAPARDWNSRIADECYVPNAARGTFERIGWDLGPTLATWLRRERRDTHDRIAAGARDANALAQAYHHSILPLASMRDRRTEIRWGLRDFELRFGHRPAGLWLPETAVDLATLRICAEEGVRYTILAPWQADGDRLETRRPYRVALGRGRSLAVCFYDGLLSAAVSFEPHQTTDADRFARERVAPRLAERFPGRTAPLVLIASDGELYGHHQKFRDFFLERLVSPIARHDFDIVTLGAVLSETTGRLPLATIRERTSWSCHHGVARWYAECPDAPDGRWKQPLRAALDRLAAAVDVLAEDRATQLGFDYWEARDTYVDVASGFASEDSRPEVADVMRATRSRLAMFGSDAWFWDDPVRPETLQALRFAAHAARLLDARLGSALEVRLVEDLVAVRSPSTGRDGSQLYRTALESVGQPAVPRVSRVRPPRPSTRAEPAPPTARAAAAARSP